MYAIVDANNFYVSCERVFDPALCGKPVIVLSNNDGCVISRSNEAKALGIAMGQPYFKIKRWCAAKEVVVLSSNYALYGDMSDRVMTLLSQLWPEVEVYSIDEAFLYLHGLSDSRRLALCDNLHRTIMRCTGIPISIGIGRTKTLAKLANHLAKKRLRQSCCDITQFWYCLSDINVADVWGVGPRRAAQLTRQGVDTALALQRCDPDLIRQRYNVTLAKVVYELRGQCCFDQAVPSPKQGITTSRSFGKVQTELTPILAAVANFCDIALQKVRAQHNSVGRLTVFLRTDPKRSDLVQRRCVQSYRFPSPTADIREISAQASRCLRQLFVPGYHYKKAGVYLDDFHDLIPKQSDLWAKDTAEQDERAQQLMKTYNSINAVYGRQSLRLAASLYADGWRASACRLSPRYTTCWGELALAR